MRLYLAGPMRGIPEYNFPAFFAAERHLIGIGHQVFNPARADMEWDGFNPKCDEPHDEAHYMARDLPEVCKADAVAVLPGWESSKGAALEVYVARVLGKPVLWATTLWPVVEQTK